MCKFPAICIKSVIVFNETMASLIGIKAPKSKKSLPQTLSVDQTIKLIDIKDSSFLGIRDHAILELFYFHIKPFSDNLVSECDATIRWRNSRTG